VNIFNSQAFTIPCILFIYFSVVIFCQPKDLNVKIAVCLHRDVVPVNVDILHCENGYHGNVTSSAPEGQGSLKVVVPYPQAGIWVLAMMMQCFKPPKDTSR
jgi:hypothetical protein